MTRVCATVMADTMADLRRRRDAVVDADLVELRLDGVADPDVAGALAGRRRPVVITCRPMWEGGRFAGSEEERHRILADAQAAGAEYVDVEWRARFDDLVKKTHGRGVVLSSHDYEGVPADLSERAREMRSAGAQAVIKLAVRANRLSDCVRLLLLRSEMGSSGPVVLIAMGERGVASRVLASKFHSEWTYGGALSEVGQISSSMLLNEYRFRKITGATEVYGVTGSPVSHSVSPAMHNAAFRAAGRDAVYLPLPAVDADDFTAFARAINLRGASVTIPFKVDMLTRVAESSDVARQVGAINTIVTRGGRWIGDNTDVEGFLRPLRDRGIALKDLRAAIAGAGGSARAVAVALLSEGSRVTIHARRQEAADEVARSLGVGTGAWPPAKGSWDLLVNCTPVGLHPHGEDSPIAAGQLTGRIVYDLIYNPAETRLLRDAKLAGCQVIGGLEMLVAQAEAQFERWTGDAPRQGVMRDAAMTRLSEFAADANHVV